MRERAERGLAAVEFALVAPLVLMLLFGTITAGLAYNDKLSIASAANEGARFGARIDHTSGSWATSVRSRVQQVYFNDGSTLQDSQVCVSLVDSTGADVTGVGTTCGTAPTSPSGLPAGSCVVKVWVKKPQSMSLVLVPTWNFDITAQAVGYYGRKTTTCTAD